MRHNTFSLKTEYDITLKLTDRCESAQRMRIRIGIEHLLRKSDPDGCSNSNEVI